MTNLQLHIFRIPSVFNMAYAPFAKYLRKKISDAYRAENLFIIFASTFVIALMLANQIAWAFIREDVLADPRGTVAVTFWLVQLGFSALLVATCMIGFKPDITITGTKTAINIQNGKEAISIPYHEIEKVEVIDAQLYHRHFKKYKATQSFVNKLEDELVLAWVAGVPYVFGVPELEVEPFAAYLQAQRTTSAPIFSFETATLV